MTTGGDVADGEPSELADCLRGPARPLRMTETGEVIGRLCSVELALFTWLGGVAPACGSPAEVVWASSAARRAAWRAAQLEDLLPVSAGLPVVGRPAEGGPPELESWLDALARSAPASARATARRWYEALADAYRFRLLRASPAADGAVVRSLQRALDDLNAELAALQGQEKPPGRGP